MPTIRRTTVRSLALIVAVAWSAVALAQDRVVFQVTDGDAARWNLVLNNVRNLQAAVGPDADVEIVAYGPAVALLKADSPIAGRIAEAVAGKTRVVACENTMAAMKLAHDDMLPAIGYVPAGVVEVMRRQQQSYAYLRP